MMGVDYEAWASSRTFQVGDSLVFEYNKDYHNVNEITTNNFELCEPSNPLVRYETGSDTVTLTKPGVHNFICGVPSHCDIGQKLQIVVLPASLGPVAAPVPRPVRSPSSFSSPSPSLLADSPVNNGPRYQMGPAPAPHSAASDSSAKESAPTMKTTIMSLLIVVLSLIGLAHAASFYEVGDFNGWTTKMGVAYYKTWSSSKTFHVGDALIFQYNKDIHNVIQVSFRDYESCNPNSALARYKSEYEPVKLNRTGHYYFICGFTGHCEAGQKLEVLVMPASLQNTTIIQQNNTSSSNPKPNPVNAKPSPTPKLKPKPSPSPPLEDPLVVLPVDDATIASLPHNAVSNPRVWSGLSMLSLILLKSLVSS
uniref:Phytocyanin domain-containing protein n=2 Tax=Brassica oleracea var. oleracea TaxID=109376 RepID=A0A0D3BTA9_BRAOL